MNTLTSHRGAHEFRLALEEAAVSLDAALSAVVGVETTSPRTLDGPESKLRPASAAPASVAVGIEGTEAGARGVVGLSDDELLTLVSVVEAVGRRVDALRVVSAGEISERSRRSLGSAGLAVRKGCRNGNELIRRLTGVASATAAKRIAIGNAAQARPTLTGHVRPARYPTIARAFRIGALGVDSARSIIDGLAPVEGRGCAEHWEAAERELVSAALGGDRFDGGRADGADLDAEQPRSPGEEGEDLSSDRPACGADETRLQALVWRAVLDPDGIEPNEERAMSSRGIRLGREHDGVVRLSGTLVAPVAASLRKLFDAYTSPKSAPVFLSTEEAAGMGRDADPRTSDQQRHDALSSVVDHAARCAESPALGGQSPAVIVTVAEDELSGIRSDGMHTLGTGMIEGVEAPVSLAAISRHACAGGIQRVVMNADGGIVELGSAQRCFTPQQRRVIAVRDGGCVIPGCGIPAAWCEIHHVREHAAGGQTHPDNGVLLCWFHHRTLETSGWRIRMKHCAPQVKAPPWMPGGDRWYPVAHTARHHHERYKRLLERDDGATDP